MKSSKSELKLRALLDDQNLILNNGIAGVSKTVDRQFVWVNDVFANNLGYKKEELIGKPGHIIYPSKQEFVEFGKKIANIHTGEHPLLRDALWLKKKDGSKAWFLVGGGPVTPGSNSAIWLSIDITQDKKNQAMLEAYLQRIEKSMSDTLVVLSKTVEMHDPYTAGHQFRVGNIAKEIGRVMGLPSQQLENLRLMGLIHDIGKIGVPAEILSKPGRLSAEELSLVRSHTKIGYEILSNVNFDIPVAEVAYQHHERIDGAGYPRALKDSSILLEARIIAVADVIEAMSSHRPYRPGLGLDVALKEVQTGRGTKYDPEVADACLKLFNERGYTLDDSYKTRI
jgi:PAS domain S-box-containing protein/putative nucleotidyltransferase with HDIG domain